MNNVEIKITGKNIDNFIKRIVSLNINIYKLNYLKYNEINIIINKTDYEKIKKLKTSYKIKLVKLYGVSRIKYNLKKYRYLLSALLIGFIFIIFLSNVIFKVEVIHSDKKVRKLVINELRNNDIKPLSFTKSYSYIQKVKKHILKKYKDKIEWLEIERNGTKYIIKLEDRKLNNEKEKNGIRNIVAKKNALILSIEASNGEILKREGSYVHKGDVLISGNIYLNDELKEQKIAEGRVYGEVWYTASIEYPLSYYEKQLLEDEKNVYTFNFSSFVFKLNYIKDYNVKIKKEVIASHKVLPISLNKFTYKKVRYIKQTLTKEEAIKKAVSYAKEKMNSKLKENEYIINTKELKVEENNSRIIVDIFFTVCEDITDFVSIEGE